MNNETVNRILSNLSVTLMTTRYSAQDAEYEYILDGIEFNTVVVDRERDQWPMDVYDNKMARLLAYDFKGNAKPEEADEALFLHNLKEKLFEVFQRADKKGYDEFIQKVEDKIRPFLSTDDRVAQFVWKLLKQSMFREKDEIFYLDEDYVYELGYKNGLIRKAADIIREHPDMFFNFPGLLIKHKAIDHSKSYYFSDIFWSPAAYSEALEILAGMFLSADGQTWIFKERGNKTAFIALFEELYVKDYLKKRLTTQEIRNVGLNSFSLDISERTFNEAPAIINARSLFKNLPVHKRYIGEEDSYDEVYKRR